MRRSGSSPTADLGFTAGFEDQPVKVQLGASQDRRQKQRALNLLHPLQGFEQHLKHLAGGLGRWLHHLGPPSDSHSCQQRTQSDKALVFVDFEAAARALQHFCQQLQGSKGRGLLNAADCRPGLKLVSIAGQRAPTTSASKNALAGGLAGGLVAICLFPVDTLKTIVQTERKVGQRSLGAIINKVTAEYGLWGLYRGLGSNLVTAAPISALYASTYEAVKAALLPHLPQKYHAVAHCTAGAMASVATSFVFTPSECVKQRMQTTSQYANSWSCLLGIARNEGFPVLYSGWGAVLARNIPNSIIKFLTYEGLKHFASEGDKDKHLPNWQTLVIGGVAGVTASFCTTPFDVIKTRLQAQMPGQALHYKGVQHCFQTVIAEEGVAGLYRGVGPRLFIYVSQGAIFFASYELLKRLLAADLQAKLRQGRQPPVVLEERPLQQPRST